MQRFVLMLAVGSLLLRSSHSLSAAEALPAGVIEKMHGGQWGSAEQQLRRRLEDRPVDDNARFALALTQIIRTFERASQFHWEHGAKFGQASFLLPANFKANPEPNRISYQSWRRELAALHRDLAVAEATLEGVRDKEVKVGIPLAKLQWDLDGDGQPQSWFPRAGELSEPLKAITRDNAEMLVTFDYADVLWFRGYCHVLMGAVDVFLSFDTELLFEAFAHNGYESPRLSAKSQGQTEDARQQAAWASIMNMKLAEPDRWRLARGHFVKVTELSLAMWDAAELETDDDHEWLPNSQQQGALRIHVDAEMITAWRAAMREAQAVLQGRKLLRFWAFSGQNADEPRGINFQKLLDNPPEQVPLFRWALYGPKEHLAAGDLYDEKVFGRVNEVFRGNTLGFALWFN